MLFDTENKYTPQLTHTDLQTAYIKYSQKRAKEFKDAIINKKNLENIAAVVVEEIENALKDI